MLIRGQHFVNSRANDLNIFNIYSLSSSRSKLERFSQEQSDYSILE
jgi:hypothetical protein